MKTQATAVQPVATPVRYRPRFDFSVTGLVYCSMMMLMGLAAINSQANLLFGVFGLMMGVLLISGVICRMVLARVRVTRTVPEYCVVGRPTTVIYHFKNRKRFWPSLSVTLTELEGTEAFTAQSAAYLLHATAGTTVNSAAQLIPKHRGSHRMGAYQLSTSFPFGFIKRAVTRKEADKVLVCPALGRVSKQLLALCRSEQRSDAPVRPRRGGQDEFYGVKEHRAGENPRWIYWRRSARAPGVLVAKEMTQVAPPRLLILVDTFLEQVTLDEQTNVERSLAMAASLAHQALEAGMSVGLCAWEGRDWLVIPVQQGKRQRRDLLAALARFPRNTTAGVNGLLGTAESLVHDDTTAVLFTTREMSVSLTDRLRGALVVVPSQSEFARGWFTFDPGVDFARCIPVESEEEPEAEPVGEAVLTH